MRSSYRTGSVRPAAVALLSASFALLLASSALAAPPPAPAPHEPPYLDADDGIAPSNEIVSIGVSEARIRLRGTTGPGTSSALVLLRVEGKGDAESYVKPQQTFLIIDDSGSMKNNDPQNIRVAAAIEYVKQIRAGDFVGLVKFSDVANLEASLTDNKNFLEQKLSSAFKSEGATNMHDGTWVANNEMQVSKLETHTQNYILLTDGCWNEGGDPQPEVSRAAGLGVRMFTIGLGEDTGNCWTGLDSSDLRKWADQTGGRYYAAPDAKDLYQIYKEIAKDIRDVAGYAPSAEPMVVLKITENIEVVPGSFTINGARAGPSSPAEVATGNKGLMLTWEKPTPRLRVGEVLDIRFYVQSYIKGEDIPVNDPLVSTLTYVRSDTSTGGDTFPPLRVDVYEPEGGGGETPPPKPWVPPGFEGVAEFFETMPLGFLPWPIIVGLVALALIIWRRRNRKRMEKGLEKLRGKEAAHAVAAVQEKKVAETGAPVKAEQKSEVVTRPASASAAREAAEQKAAARRAVMRKTAGRPAGPSVPGK